MWKALEWQTGTILQWNTKNISQCRSRDVAKNKNRHAPRKTEFVVILPETGINLYTYLGSKNHSHHSVLFWDYGEKSAFTVYYLLLQGMEAHPWTRRSCVILRNWTSGATILYRQLCPYSDFVVSLLAFYSLASANNLSSLRSQMAT